MVLTCSTQKGIFDGIELEILSIDPSALQTFGIGVEK